jgi:hypothetical protein
MNLYKFFEDCGRTGCLEGLFLEEAETVEKYIGRVAYFGEVLGKHSDICVEVTNDNIELISDDQKLINILSEIYSNGHMCGFNPIATIRENEELFGDVDEEDDTDELNEDI